MSRAGLAAKMIAGSSVRVWCARIAAGTVAVALLAGTTELVCRYKLGLGDPPLVVGDSEIAYFFQPNQTCRRFGNLIHYNAYGMRSDDFPPTKADRAEFRVMVIGDSVINGGALTDQRDVCTSILQRQLVNRLKRPVKVGNISAGGWGPLNQWPYVRKFGLFDADIMVLVLSSHDASSAFQGERVAGVDAAFPDHRPWSATWEAATRYLPHFLRTLSSESSNEGYKVATEDARVTLQCQAAIKQMKLTADRIGAKSVVVLHWSRSELERAQSSPGWRPTGHLEIEATAKEMGMAVIDLYAAEAAGGGKLFRDEIHVNAAGQQVVERGIEEGVIVACFPHRGPD